jgi:hypothetical protein
MILRIFRRTGPGVIFLIIVTLFSVWASAFIKLLSHSPLNFNIDPMPLYGILLKIIGSNPLPGVIFIFLLLLLMSFLLVNLNTSLFFINERTFLPAVIYILLSGLFPQQQVLNPALPAAIFLILAIRRIMDSYRVSGTAYNFFDAGILIATGSLFYANLIWFGLLAIIGIALIRAWNFKEIAISFLGLATPFILTFGIYYVFGKELGTFVSILKYNLFGKISGFIFSRITVIVLIFSGLTVMISLGHLFSVMNTKKIKSRNTFYLLLWVFIISITIFFALSSVSVEILWITGIPVSYILTHYLIFAKNKLIPEISLYLLFILIGLIETLYLI